VTGRMGKASSAKKIKRVQQAGATRAPGQRRNLGYPLLIGGIVVVGLVLTFFAVGHRRHVEQVAPTVDDKWAMAYATNICGDIQEQFPTVVKNSPVDQHADGLIHVHPTNKSNAGANAQFGLFLKSANIQVADGSITLPNGKTFKDGDDCKGKPGRVALYVWPPQASDKTDPRIITKGIASTRFTDDGQAYVLAFVPRDANVKLPPMSKLDSPDNAEPKVAKSETATTVAGETTTTVAGETTTTVAPAQQPTTTTGG
jgi:hypothetical protein